MNEFSHSEHGFDPQVLDRLVDGELADGDRRTVLESLERQPDGWRQCALAFLESADMGPDAYGLRASAERRTVRRRRRGARRPDGPGGISSRELCRSAVTRIRRGRERSGLPNRRWAGQRFESPRGRPIESHSHGAGDRRQLLGHVLAGHVCPTVFADFRRSGKRAQRGSAERRQSARSRNDVRHRTRSVCQLRYRRWRWSASNNPCAAGRPAISRSCLCRRRPRRCPTI